MSQSFADNQSTLLPEFPPCHATATLETGNLSTLAADLMADGPLPTTELELAATLESHGVTDEVAGRYSAHDVFELARKMLEGQPRTSTATETIPAERPPRLAATLARGPLMFLMIGTAMLGLHFFEAALRSRGAPIWTTALGLTLGIMIAGGFMPALGWRISMALSQHTPDIIPRLVANGLGLGLGIAGITSALLVGGAALYHVPPAGLFALGLSALGLTLWLLLSGTLIVLDQLLVASTAPGLAFGLGWLANRLGLATYGRVPGLALGYAALILMLGGWLAVVLRHLPGRDKQRVVVALPPAGQILYGATPYACYGALAVIYVFVGPLAGWFGHLTPGWTREPAVAAMNIIHLLGFSTVILSQGATEYALRTFWMVLRDAEQQTAAGDLPAIRAAVWEFVRRRLWMLLGVQTAIALALARLAPWLWQQYDLTPTLGPLNGQLLFTSLLAYTYLAWGLFNCSLLVALAQPWEAGRALLFATGLQIGCMLTFDLAAGFQSAILGSVIGGVGLVLLTHRALGRLLAHADYMLYQAF